MSPTEADEHVADEWNADRPEKYRRYGLKQEIAVYRKRIRDRAASL
jgi:hypothetical protein